VTILELPRVPCATSDGPRPWLWSLLSGGGTTGAAADVSVVESRLPGIGSDLSLIKGGDGGLSCKS
jgi:hypothetical protein